MYLPISTIRFKNEAILLLCRLHAISHNTVPPSAEPFAAEGWQAYLRISSTNNMIELSGRGRRLYFRSCKQHVPLNRLAEQILEDYKNLCGGSEALLFLRNSLARKKTRDTFLRMGNINDPSSRCYRYFKHSDPSLLGLPKDTFLHINSKQLDTFVHYAWSEILSHRQNRGGGHLQLFHYNRCKCQQTLYQLLGVQRLTCTVTLAEIQGRRRYIGSLMEEARGRNPLSLPKGMIESHHTPQLSKELDILHIMDVLCYERDHRPGNYNVVFNENNQAVSIQAFDNDSSLTFFPTTSIGKDFLGCPPIVDKNGMLTLSHIEEEFATRVCNAKDEEIAHATKPYLNRLQKWCLIQRLHKLQKALHKTIANRPGFLIPAEQWNKRASTYASPYYKKLINWNEGEKDDVLLRQGKIPLIPINL